MPRCDDAVEDIDTEARFFIAIDLDSGYWQILAEKEARTRLAFFTPEGKKRWKDIPMGALNSTATFVTMMNTLKSQWDELAANEVSRMSEAKSLSTMFFCSAELWNNFSHTSAQYSRSSNTTTLPST